MPPHPAPPPARACPQWTTGDVWKVVVPVPVHTPLSFKFVKLDSEGACKDWGCTMEVGAWTHV